MRAIVRRYDKEGRPGLASNAHITPEYKSLQTMRRYWLRNMPAGRYQVEIYANWDNRYKDPDKVFDWEN